MGKNKLKRFRENLEFSHMIQPKMAFPFEDHPLKGKWKSEFFRRDAPIVLELGCGRGEYTVNLAKMFPEKNFIGIDWKGARLWRGAKTVQEDCMDNVAFLRIQIHSIAHFFEVNEVDEIWITFPDPQLRESKEMKRLTSPRYLDYYRKILKPDALINLKTDSHELYNYTLDLCSEMNYKIFRNTSDLYHSEIVDEVLEIKTTYEKRWLNEGLKICYLQFSIDK
ncbi:MAG: tRNA (guanosine(46)-N7)-methyltransferase TrmB [Bacteroidetes bacterium]|nr:MAG: tRNA (guanosine(46)-N7)-methyltransferase TrmB [Bacteroidota bacterium]REK03444.1 MAG: tRNA (guanosine(46)-N7)-methyltransferase TrmB [Bacteroidota bacterium]REK34444.1 MAG: tRNA (guanosine(46)-N7)-methyltransferase TrmB [Bacteroidota bacterium]REK50438.1 MAG: tRNA (guanosine(46)-N7)-methyltransferase TrmB [Bacteroidota bacterium]